MMAIKSNGLKTLVSTTLVGLFLGGAYLGLRSHRASVPTPQPVAAVPIEPLLEKEAPPRAPKSFLGVILAGQASELSSRVEARLETVLVRPGDRIAQGDVIAQLDVRSIRHELAVAEATLREARQRFARRANLSRGAISREELVEVKTQIVEKTARVKQLRESIDDARLVAPFDGVVAARYFEPGSVVPAGRPIVRVIGNDAARVRFAVPEQQATQVSVGMRMRVQLETLNGPLPAVVENVAPEVETASRMIFSVARVEIPARLKQRISSGLEAHVAPADSADGALVVEARERNVEAERP